MLASGREVFPTEEAHNSNQAVTFIADGFGIWGSIWGCKNVKTQPSVWKKLFHGFFVVVSRTHGVTTYHSLLDWETFFVVYEFPTLCTRCVA
jgi:hypothetical protein